MTKIGRARVWLLVFGATGIIGCSRILGIDGEYALESQDGSDGRENPLNEIAKDASTRDSGLENAKGGSGGQLAESGGTAGLPGDEDAEEPTPLDGGDDAEAETHPDAGAAPIDPCAPGRYEGTFAGIHRPTPVPGVPLAFGQYDVSGTVTLVFERISDDAGTTTLTITEGTLHGGGMQSSFDATITGSVDCATGWLDGVLVDGIALFQMAPWYTFAGTITGTLDPSGLIQGQYQEAQQPEALGANGEGTWSAQRVAD